jgi:hypothetical protein
MAEEVSLCATNKKGFTLGEALFIVANFSGFLYCP